MIGLFFNKNVCRALISFLMNLAICAICFGLIINVSSMGLVGYIALIVASYAFGYSLVRVNDLGKSLMRQEQSYSYSM